MLSSLTSLVSTFLSGFAFYLPIHIYMIFKFFLMKIKFEKRNVFFQNPYLFLLDTHSFHEIVIFKQKDAKNVSHTLLFRLSILLKMASCLE